MVTGSCRRSLLAGGTGGSAKPLALGHRRGSPARRLRTAADPWARGAGCWGLARRCPASGRCGLGGARRTRSIRIPDAPRRRRSLVPGPRGAPTRPRLVRLRGGFAGVAPRDVLRGLRRARAARPDRAPASRSAPAPQSRRFPRLSPLRHDAGDGQMERGRMERKRWARCRLGSPCRSCFYAGSRGGAAIRRVQRGGGLAPRPPRPRTGRTALAALRSHPLMSNGATWASFALLGGASN